MLNFQNCCLLSLIPQDVWLFINKKRTANHDSGVNTSEADLMAPFAFPHSLSLYT